MPRLTIEGGHPLKGDITASGAKNAALPILAATVLMDGDSQLANIPFLKDVHTMIRMLNSLNIVAHHKNDTVYISNTKKIRHIAPYELVTAMRASFFVAGPILAKTGFAKVPMPGGCSIGARPIDIHLKGFEALGATVSIEHGFVSIQAKQLKGAYIYLDFPSVGATENIMMAAVLAEGETHIENAAREPEIWDLANLLNKAGAQISGAGTSSIVIKGVTSLSGTSHTVISDRVEAGTLLIAGGITKGDVTVHNIQAEYLEPVISKLKEAGLGIDVHDNAIRCYYTGRPSGVDIETLPFPGFPTDMQAQMMTLLCITTGVSVIRESIFENRFMHALELIRMGANIKLNQSQAVITGIPQFTGAEVKITDLRAGAALILAGLQANGRTTVYGLKHLKRGYFDLPGKLIKLGAVIDQ